MDRFERRAQAIMERGDRIIADRQKKNTMIRRISFSVSGLCAAALIVIGIWKSPALHRVPEIPQLPETVTTEAAETTEPATEQTTTPAEEKTTKPKKTEAATEAATAIPTTVAPAPETVPAAASAAPVRTEAPQAVQTQAAVTEAPASATEAQTAAEIPVSTAEPEQPTDPVQQPEEGEELATAPPLQCPTWAVTEPALGGGAATPTVTQAPSQQPVVPRTIAHNNNGGASGEETHTEVSGTTPVQNPTEPSVYVLPTTPDDPNGIKAVCREYGLPDIAPSYIPAGFELTDLFLDDSSLGTELIFTYTRKAADGGYEYISLFYGISKQPGNFSYFDMIIPPDDTELKAFDINGHELQYYYSSSESTLKGLYMTDAFLFNLYTTGLNKYYAERVVRSVS
jgi:hypothetical protein